MIPLIAARNLLLSLHDVIDMGYADWPDIRKKTTVRNFDVSSVELF